jgi:cellulose biosynthesis protein BcsQ
MTKILSLYNNKGGVAKTTTLFNLAVYAAKQRNKKVLLVDCDPQCNSTELFFCSSDQIDEPDSGLPGTSIYEALRPRFEGDASRIDASKVELASSPLYSNLFLLRGDINFSRAEQFFAASVAQAITESIHDKNTYAAMGRLLRDLGKLHGFDYILCDVGPSAGSITRMVILSCDGIFVPTAPDRFSHQAILGMGAIMSEWLERHRAILSTFAPYGLQASLSEPTFYGAIINNYKIHRAGKKKGSYLKWEQLIQEAIKNSLLDGKGLKPSNDNIRKNPFVASIRDVGPMAPVAQMVGKAIFDIAQRDTELASSDGDYYRGAVWSDWVGRMSEYEQEVSKIYNAIG